RPSATGRCCAHWNARRTWACRSPTRPWRWSSAVRGRAWWRGARTTSRSPRRPTWRWRNSWFHGAGNGNADRAGLRRPCLWRGRPRGRRRRAGAARARRAGPLGRRRGDTRAVRRHARGAGPWRHRPALPADGSAVEGRRQPRLPAPLPRAGGTRRLEPGQCRHHRHLRAPEDRPPCPGDEGNPRRRPAGRRRPGQRQGHHQREARFHRARRGHRRHGGVPAHAGRSTVGEGGLPRAHGAPVLQGRYRVRREDFRVTELPSFEADGSGEHLLLTVTKRGMNTAHAVRRIAGWAGVQERDVGHAGLKDRHAVTTQRFSVWLPGRPDPDPAEPELEEGGESLRVVDAARHSRKLARGALSGNRFTLVLRELQGGRDGVEARLQAIAAAGVPNYFGVQRFGHGGGNVGKALAMFAGRRVGREQRTLLLSAARSQL